MIKVDKKLFEKFPDAKIYTFVARGLNNKGESSELLEKLREAEKEVRHKPELEDYREHPYIASWREAFRAFDFNPNKNPPSVANLIKRTRSGTELPFVSKLVCIFNIISLKYIIPAGADDTDCLEGQLVLGPALGDEKYYPLAGGKMENPKPGEIILYDDANKTVFCRAWCWKNGDPSKITEDTHNATINLDILPPVSEEHAEKAAEELERLIKKYCGGELEKHLFTKDLRKAELS